MRAAGADPGDGVILLVGDAAILDRNLADGAIEGLREVGFEVDVRPAVSGEPTANTIRELLPADPGPVGGVVAVGGGSALDAAKLVALLIVEEIDLAAGLTTAASMPPTPPLLAVPTTAGTGSEATAVAMLWEGRRKLMFVSGALVPDAALLDPDLLAGLPAAVTAAGGLDAISHAVESLLSTFRTPLTEAAAYSALSLLPESVVAAYETGAPAAREKTLLGAFQAGLALNASVVLGHSLAYAIAAEAGLSHGVSCAMALPYCIAHARPGSESTIDDIADIVSGEPGDGESLIRWLLDANERMSIPASLEAVGIGRERLDEIARTCVESYPRPNHPEPIEIAGVRALLDHFLVGDPLAAWSQIGAAA